MYNWNGLLKILEIKHISQDGSILWSENNILNLLHIDGEEYILSNVFAAGATSNFHTSKTDLGYPQIPTNYYIGADNRTVPSENDVMANIVGEPNSNGYARQPVSSSTGFSIGLGIDGHQRAITGTIVFSASGGAWGPIKNIFLSNKNDNNGYLISTASLSSSRTVNNGESLTLRVSMSLKDVS